MLNQRLLALFDKYGFAPRDALSQNFMIDERVLARIAAHAHGTCLEIGAGFGFLTRELCKRAEKVIAVEKDARLIPALREQLADCDNATIVHADFMDYNAPAVDTVVSNIPYSISSQIVFKLVRMRFGRAVLCLQREFAKRIIAAPSTRDYSRLSVMAQLSFKARIVERIPRSAFYPPPNVDSALIELVPTGYAPSEFESNTINALFQHRNQSVRNALLHSRHMLGASKESMKKACGTLKNAERRVVSLSKEEVLGACTELRSALGAN
jgi:16S rRNA (adenine1518-N6/adenine1519-N6)-dimethyltransferase